MIDINKTTAKYLVLDLTTYDIREEEKGPMEDSEILRNIVCRTTEMWFRRVEPGTFIMGTPENELGYLDTETQHKVTLTKPFYVGVFQVTQKQYELIVGKNPSLFKDDISPVECVTYDMIRGSEKGASWPVKNDVDDYSFLGKLNSNANITFDLPTESQWEYACRAGTTTAWNNGKNITSGRDDPELDMLGCYAGNGLTHKTVGSFLPNAWGLYDMHGNVWEWCLDWIDSIEDKSVTDPKGPKRGDWRVIRGGSVGNDAVRCRAAHRFLNAPDKASYLIGFRLVINLNAFAASKKNTTKTSQAKRLVDFNTLTSTKAKYLVLDLQTYEMREEKRGPIGFFSFFNSKKCKTTELWLRRIEPGTFIMGSPENTLGRNDDEVQHKVTITKPFYIGVFEITQKQYELITGENPSDFKGDSRPVENVSYDMIRGKDKGANWPSNNEVDDYSFLGKLRAKVNMPFDLPTEAQWEYACRAGTLTALNNGKNLTNVKVCRNMNKVGRYYETQCDGKGGYKEHTVVGSYIPNAWGLYDMHGNVYEWCLDWYYYYDIFPAIDPKGAETGKSRVLRGGGWCYFASGCLSSSRYHIYPNFTNYDGDRGFRVALVL